jgi:radical SAM protein with 4Fe4S-binding SPASM domain
MDLGSIPDCPGAGALGDLGGQGSTTETRAGRLRGLRRFTFQWHVTERCNLRCAHCYQEAYGGAELGFEQWLEVLAQLSGLRDRLERSPGRRPHLHLNLTGGEPFVHPDLLRFLETLAARREDTSFAILSNGELMDALLARRLAELGPAFIQVSLEGGAATHDRLRGRGSFARTVTAVRHLTQVRIPVLVSFTAHRGNFREFGEVVRTAAELGVKRVWADRLIPLGSGAGPGLQTLSSTETREFLDLMRAARDGLRRRWFGRTEVAQHRALQFLTGDEAAYHCTAGDSLLALLPNGDLVPCRRLPIRVGNVLETPLARLYQEHPLLRALRAPEPVISGCERCAFRRVCRGGLRCLAYAERGDPFRSDPGCWLADGPVAGTDGRMETG